MVWISQERYWFFFSWWQLSRGGVSTQQKCLQCKWWLIPSSSNSASQKVSTICPSLEWSTNNAADGKVGSHGPLDKNAQINECLCLPNVGFCKENDDSASTKLRVKKFFLSLCFKKRHFYCVAPFACECCEKSTILLWKMKFEIVVRLCHHYIFYKKAHMVDRYRKHQEIARFFLIMRKVF